MSTYQTLISPAQLQALQQSGSELLIVDVSFDLSDVEAGQRA